MSRNFNLENDYGWLLEGILKYESDIPTTDLTHFGVKGMKWGVRKDEEAKPQLTGLGPDSITRTTKSGDVITLTKNPPTLLHKGLAKISKNYRDSYANSAFLTIRDASGKQVGDAQMWIKGEKKDELYLNWLGIDDSARGRGYASAALKGAAEFGQQHGLKRMTLEVPGHSPDARHIYEKQGFKATRVLSTPEEDPTWSGLTEMVYEFDEVKHADEVEDFLEHYGVKGMKWGVVKERQQVISRAEHLKNGTEYKAGLTETAKLLKAYGNKAALEAGDFQRQFVMGKAYLEGREHAFKKDPSLAHKKDVDGIMKDVVAQINPDFGKPGTKMNCRRCTFAYEMRRRGLDVKATETTNASGQHVVGLKNAVTPGRDNATRGAAFIKEANAIIKRGENIWGDHEVKFPDFDTKAYKKQLKKEAKENGTKTNWFKRNSQTYDAIHEARATNIRSELAKQGDGARGEVGLAWAMGGGHSVAYEVVKGNPVIFDTQSGKKYDTPKALAEMLGMAGSVSYTRLDDKPLNDDYLRRWVQDA